MISTTAISSGTTVAAARARGNASSGTATAGAITGRYAGALQLLSISTLLTRSGSASVNALQPGGTASMSDLASIARTFQEKFGDAASSAPFSPEANQRHIAQYETIMAHRGNFPPGEFFIHTELGEGASITTRVPPAGEAKEPEPPTKISLNVTSIVASMEKASGGITIASAAAAYAQWS